MKLPPLFGKLWIVSRATTKDRVATRMPEQKEIRYKLTRSCWGWAYGGAGAGASGGANGFAADRDDRPGQKFLPP